MRLLVMEILIQYILYIMNNMPYDIVHNVYKFSDLDTFLSLRLVSKDTKLMVDAVLRHHSKAKSDASIQQVISSLREELYRIDMVYHEDGVSYGPLWYLPSPSILAACYFYYRAYNGSCDDETLGITVTCNGELIDFHKIIKGTIEWDDNPERDTDVKMMVLMGSVYYMDLSNYNVDIFKSVVRELDKSVIDE